MLWRYGHAFMPLFRFTVVYKLCVPVWGWGLGRRSYYADLIRAITL